MNSLVIIREMTLADRDAQDQYFSDASDEFLFGLGCDPAKVREMMSNRSTTAFENAMRIPLAERQATAFAFMVEGRLIGASSVFPIIRGEKADIHLHIFKEEDRKSGYAFALLPDFLRLLFQTFDLQTIIAQPTASNAAPNKLLNKLGLSPVATFEAPASGILRPRISNRYEIHRDWFNSNF